MLSLDIIIPAYNAEHCLSRTLEGIFRQALPATLDLGVVVVNNRSTDDTVAVIGQWAERGVRRVDHLESQGRSATINAGVAASQADYVLVLDADCVLVGHDCLRLVGDAMTQGIDAGFGYATGTTDDFWGRYHRALAAHRMTAGWQGWTTQCCVIRREPFNAVAGFPTDYQHYGFEDRDFICRLRLHEGIGELRSLTHLRATHDDDTTARDVFEKMYTSGRYSSGIFKRNFPEEYGATVYAPVDIDTAPKIMLVALQLLRPLRPVFVHLAAFLSERRRTPLAIGRPFIKLCSAQSYFQGTVDRNSHT